tara:strand:+ start:71 stop:757 length:687 start_codon:yes stop_codon:yes gene_type:complete
MPSLYQMLSGGMTAEEHREQSMLNIAKKRADAKTMPKPQLDIHSGLDLLGMTPGVGAAADLLNTALYTAKGDKKGALISLAQAVPLVGLGTSLAKLTRPANQIRTATSFSDAYQSWYKNLNELEFQHSGSVNWKEIQKDVTNSGMNTNSQGFYEFIKDYSKEKFGGLVTVPKPSITGKRKVKGKFARETDKKQKVVKSPIRQGQSEEMARERKSKKGAYFTRTRRSEY